MIVGDASAIQLMQVPQITEEVVILFWICYPALLSLAHSYALLKKDTRGEMPRRQTKDVMVQLLVGILWRDLFSNQVGGGLCPYSSYCGQICIPIFHLPFLLLFLVLILELHIMQCK